MPPRTLASLAHALGATAGVDGSLAALSEALAELDRGALLALYPYDARREQLSHRLWVEGGTVHRTPLETSLEHLPSGVRHALLMGEQWSELADRSADYARLLGFGLPLDGGIVLRGIRVEGYLTAVLALTEPRRIFGARLLERVTPAVTLFDLAFARHWERDAREEAVRTLEDVTRRVHGEYVRKLADLERALDEARRTPTAQHLAVDPAGAPPLVPATVPTATGSRSASPAARDAVQAERTAALATESARRAERRADLLEQQLAGLTAQVESAQRESHRRGEQLRQTERTLYLLDRVLTLDASAHEPRQLVDGLLALVGDDMQAQRCSLMLRAPEPGMLYLAAARGLAPHIVEGSRVRIGQGVSGRVAESREPILVQDVRDATTHPLLQDQYFTSGSFISFPLVYHDDLVGVVNLTNRAASGRYSDADVERVRLLGLVIALVATHARLPERLVSLMGVA